MSETFSKAINLFFRTGSTDINPLEHPLEWDDSYECDADWRYPR